MNNGEHAKRTPDSYMKDRLFLERWLVQVKADIAGLSEEQSAKKEELTMVRDMIKHYIDNPGSYDPESNAFDYLRLYLDNEQVN